MSAHAYRLAWFDGEQYVTSQYGYFQPVAAEHAAATLNRVRTSRVCPPYTHVVAYEDQTAIDVRPLEAAA